MFSFRRAASNSSKAAGSSASPSSHSAAAPEPKRARLPTGNNVLVSSNGVLVSELRVGEYEARLQLMADRYGDNPDQRHSSDHVRKVLQALLLADVRKVDNVGIEHLSRAERGAWNLACYLHCVQQLRSHSFLEHGAKVWMERQLIQYAEHDEQKRCIQLALQFLAQLTAGQPPPPEGPPALAVPKGLSDRLTRACPPRTGSIAQTATSRKDIRQDAMDSLRDTRGYVGEMQALAEANREPVLFTAKQEGARGRMLGIGQLQGARALVQAKVATSKMREDDYYDEEDLEDDGMDCFARQPGRRRAAPSQDQPSLLRGYQYELPPPPKKSSARQHLLGWRCKVTFPTGKSQNLEWHDGFIIGWTSRADMHCWYRVFFSVDGGTMRFDGDDLPDTSISFRKPNLPGTNESLETVRRAHAAINEEGSDSD